MQSVKINLVLEQNPRTKCWLRKDAILDMINQNQNPQAGIGNSLNTGAVPKVGVTGSGDSQAVQDQSRDM